ncbi:MAG TPA: hypothetical protein P5307_16985, partial [Pirellulaceae bacterium]|nr:hypothetical protein [Pirellulaceae bacterium]
DPLDWLLTSKRRQNEGDPFKVLQEEMITLRCEVEQLRERDQPTTLPEADRVFVVFNPHNLYDGSPKPSTSGRNTRLC